MVQFLRKRKVTQEGWIMGRQRKHYNKVKRAMMVFWAIFFAVLLSSCEESLLGQISIPNAPQTEPSVTESDISDAGEASVSKNLFEYELAEEGDGVYITKYTGDDETVAIPSLIEGLPVVSIRGITGKEGIIVEGAFESSNLKVVIIPECVESIEYKAFTECQSLTEVVLFSDSKLQSIGREAFKGCSALEKFDLSLSQIKRLDYAAFEGCASLRELAFPKSLAFIGENAFSGCSSLVELRFPDYIEIETGAFAHCTSLKKVTIPKNFRTEQYTAPMIFFDIPSLEQVVFEEGVERISGVFKFSSDVEVLIPKSVNYFSCFDISDEKEGLTITLKFLGDCPQTFWRPNDSSESRATYSIYYNPDAKGWDNFRWKDQFQLIPMDEDVLDDAF
ncbi:MAG: leucine-rich repeat domain-containing protein [Clostridia bacterium]|nr:leucine-rich repeat domain-containing protein [Clostridia bacterium]